MYVHVSIDSNWFNCWQLLSGCVHVIPQESTAVLDATSQTLWRGKQLNPSKECHSRNWAVIYIPYNCLHWGEYCKKNKKTKQNKTVLSALLDNRLYTETQCTTWVWAYTRNGVERKFRAGYGEICESVGAGSVCKIHIRPIDSRSDLPISNTEYLHYACVH